MYSALFNSLDQFGKASLQILYERRIGGVHRDSDIARDLCELNSHVLVRTGYLKLNSR